MRKHLAVLFACLFVVMIGYGLTLPVLTFYIERMALAEGATSQKASVHVGMLTGVFALMQFFFAPLWGKWSDRVGRQPLFLIGLGGYAITNVLFGLGTNLFMLYTARILGGVLSAAVLPAASAYVADVTSAKDRGKGMAWLASAISLGLVVGPAIGAWLSRLNLPLTCSIGHFNVDDFSIPFFAAAFLGVAALFSARVWLGESLPLQGVASNHKSVEVKATVKSIPRWPLMRGFFVKLLGMSFLGQFALTLFEGTFALHGQRVLGFGPAQMGLVFVICGLVMAATQISVVGWLINRIGEKPLLSVGFGLMAVGLILLMTATTLALVLVYVAIFAFGIALVTPSLATLVSKHDGKRSGTALGWQSAVNSLGQAGGPLAGGLLFAWYIHMPYLLTAFSLAAVAIFVGRKT